ncbi:hypothetical protein [Nostoc sp. FACHB-110]|uniref:hypothetical protein n=1 Tax=Nostoc sp. FACHB-110 TaxID=2692834 RepID=UPI00168A2822|nr:hypothetical protein [Nostoc sp. FACHB-110]MBD2436814.1 hypothetical protein [Nostoc sp. FACHB-110]
MSNSKRIKAYLRGCFKSLIYYFPWRLEIARHLLQVGEPAQRNGLATQTKPTFVG